MKAKRLSCLPLRFSAGTRVRFRPVRRPHDNLLSLPPPLRRMRRVPSQRRCCSKKRKHQSRMGAGSPRACTSTSPFR